MKKKIILVLLLLLAAFTLGCVAPAPGGAIRSQQDVTREITNISQDVEDVSSKLREIDERLG